MSCVHAHTHTHTCTHIRSSWQPSQHTCTAVAVQHWCKQRLCHHTNCQVIYPSQRSGRSQSGSQHRRGTCNEPAAWWWCGTTRRGIHSGMHGCDFFTVSHQCVVQQNAHNWQACVESVKDICDPPPKHTHVPKTCSSNLLLHSPLRLTRKTTSRWLWCIHVAVHSQSQHQHMLCCLQDLTHTHCSSPLVQGVHHSGGCTSQYICLVCFCTTWLYIHILHECSCMHIQVQCGGMQGMHTDRQSHTLVKWQCWEVPTCWVTYTWGKNTMQCLRMFSSNGSWYETWSMG